MPELTDVFQRRLTGITLEFRAVTIPRGIAGDKECVLASEDNCCLPESGDSGSGDSGSGAGSTPATVDISDVCGESGAEVMPYTLDATFDGDLSELGTVTLTYDPDFSAGGHRWIWSGDVEIASGCHVRQIQLLFVSSCTITMLIRDSFTPDGFYVNQWSVTIDPGTTWSPFHASGSVTSTSGACATANPTSDVDIVP